MFEILGGFLLLFSPIILLVTSIVLIIFVINKEYKQSTYYLITKQPYFSMRFDTGKYGEYLIYKNLNEFENVGAKFLFNAYIPKVNGQTTEIDVLMICRKGIFVFESKNYSGWIFGSESQKYWYQILPAGRGRSHKESFYNPIMQNRTHIKHLKELLGEQITMYSIIAFSERCTIKQLQKQNNDVSVIYRNSVYPVVSGICNMFQMDLLSEVDIVSIYNKLYPYTQVDFAVKQQHIANIHNNMQIVKEVKKPVVLTEKDENAILIQPAGQHMQVLGKNLVEEKRGLDRCPRCNGKLVLRTAKKGVNMGKQFYGCTNYPKCRYIQNIK